MLEELGLQISQLEKNFSFDPNEVYYYNAQRPKELILALQWRHNNFDVNNVYKIFERFPKISKIKNVEVNTSKWTGHVIAFVTTAKGNYVYRQTMNLPVPESYMLFEKDIIEKYEKINIPSVDILECGSEPWFERQIMKVLPGKNLKEMNLNKKQYDDITLQIGEIAAKQYHLPMEWRGRIIKENGQLRWYKKTHHDHFTGYLDYDLSVIGISEIVDNASISLLENHLFGDRTQEIFSNTESYLIDNDLPDHNVRIHKGKVSAIYDRENAVIFDPICELGSLPTRAFPYPKKQKLIEWFNNYIQKSWLKGEVDLSHFDEKIALYFLRTMLRKMPMAIKGNKLSMRHINLFNEALKDNKLDRHIKVNPEAVKILVGNR